MSIRSEISRARAALAKIDAQTAWVLVITAFNFPMAVWAWNAMLAFICGDPVLWKPSPDTPLCAIACHKIVLLAAEKCGIDKGISSLVQGDAQVGDQLVQDPRYPLVSATGSVAMGKTVAAKVASRLGKHLLELGGNNALIVSEHANVALALHAVVFSAIGTSGQRCTSLRRLFLHSSIKKAFIAALLKAYESVRIGDPRDPKTLMGPIIHQQAVDRYLHALNEVDNQGGVFHLRGRQLSSNELDEEIHAGFYVTPSIVEIHKTAPILHEEVFAPLLYIIEFESIDEAIELQNQVPQGLSSAIFTDKVQEAELFLSATGSDCGIANVNIGTSGAEIGGAFGGEKDTGGGRESGSDAWKQYMRRSTNTINYGSSIPLAQGIRFEL